MLLDSVLISIHNKNLLSIKKHTSKLVLSDSDNNGNRSTSCFFFVFGSFNHQLLFKLRSTQILQTKRKKAITNFKHMPTSQRVAVLVQLLLNINVTNSMNTSDVYNKVSYAIFDILRNLTTPKTFGKECTKRHYS